ncbi:MAG: hypothetical protein GY756_04130 [bacterium]|nr:hypothetical protein [bacterium]
MIIKKNGKIHRFTQLLLAFALGAVITAYVSEQIHKTNIDNLELYGPNLNLIQSLAAAKMLRKNNVKGAIKFEEWCIQVSIFTINQLYTSPEHFPKSYKLMLIKSLTGIKKYYKVYKVNGKHKQKTERVIDNLLYSLTKT